MKDIHVNQVIHFEGYENNYPNIHVSHFQSFNNQHIPVKQAFPDVIYVKDPLRFFAKPELYPYPSEVKAIWCNDFVDGIQTQHSSALAPSITMVQTRMVNGLNPILAGYSRIYLGLSTIGRAIQYSHLDKNKLVWEYC